MATRDNQVVIWQCVAGPLDNIVQCAFGIAGQLKGSGLQDEVGNQSHPWKLQGY